MTTVVELLLGLVALVGVAASVVLWRIRGLDSKQKRNLLKQKVKTIFLWLEDRKLARRYPAFVHDYHADYPGLRQLEASYPVVRQECLGLLGIKERLTDVSAMGGHHTAGGIHTIRWKSFTFKSGEFIEENCRLCPEATRLLRGIPGLYTAFFSILDPHQYVTPHYGYYRGFVRYHLGVIIPHNNADEKCWLRVNADATDNASNDKSRIDRGEKYYWKNGEGVIFDDTNLHDAENGSDEVRVVLWLDIRKKLPLPLDVMNRLVLYIAHHDRSVKKIRKNSTVTIPPSPPPAGGPHANPETKTTRGTEHAPDPAEGAARAARHPTP